MVCRANTKEKENEMETALKECLEGLQSGGLEISCTIAAATQKRTTVIFVGKYLNKLIPREVYDNCSKPVPKMTDGRFSLWSGSRFQ